MNEKHKATFVATVGSALECYDFVIYAALIPYLNVIFFPASTSSMQTFYVLMVFAIGYVSRPIGGLIFGIIGDKIGRKKAFVFSVFLMTVATLAMAFLPTYSQIGGFSSALLILCRYLQGISQGGEVPGAITFVSEHADINDASKQCSFIFLGLGFGALLSSLVCYILTSYLTKDSIIAWGWRLPFLFGAMMGVFTFFIRKKSLETPYYKKNAEFGRIVNPLFYLLNNHKRGLLTGISMVILPACLVTFTLTYPAYMLKFTSIKTSNVYLIMSLGMIAMALLSPVFGKISDKFGAKKIFFINTIVCTVLCPFLFSLISIDSILLSTVVILIMQTFIASFLGSFPVLLANIFPTQVRYTGIALSYNLGFVVSAFVPMLVNYIILQTENHIFTGLLFSTIGLLAFLIWNISYNPLHFLREEKRII